MKSLYVCEKCGKTYTDYTDGMLKRQIADNTPTPDTEDTEG